MRDTPSWAGRHLPGPDWSSGWSYRWHSWSCGGHFRVLLAAPSFLLLWSFNPCTRRSQELLCLGVEGRPSCGSIKNGSELFY